MRTDIIQLIKQKKDIEKIVNYAIKNPKSIKLLVEQIGIEKRSIKFQYDKVLRLISEKKPELIYPYFNEIAKLLDSDNSFLKWGAIATISNLSTVDTKDKFNEIFDKYYAPVTGPVLVTSVSIIGNSWKIAIAKPELAEKITNEILKIEDAQFIHKGQSSPECLNVAFGQAIDSLEKIYEHVPTKNQINKFVKKQLNNTRDSTRKKAEQFCKKYHVN